MRAPQQASRSSSQLATSALVALAAALLLSACEEQSSQGATMVSAHPWSGSGDDIVVDTHIHSNFSDGAHSMLRIAERAATSGCDAIAYTDNATQSTRTATTAYFDEIDRVQDVYPQLVVLAGMEWNVPSHGGREQVNMLMKREVAREVLPEFRSRFDNKGSTTQALQWLDSRLQAGQQAVLFYNHPSRSDEQANANAQDLLAWRSSSQRVAGFQGAPGQQNRRTELGGYAGTFKTTDRWDPVVDIGAGWDTVLDAGENAWAAMAVTEFRNNEVNHGPCAFSRTHVNVRDRTEESLLAALRAGAFWADHGVILSKLKLGVMIDGLDRPAEAGEVVEADASVAVDITLDLERGIGATLAPLSVEFIGNCAGGFPQSMRVVELGANDIRTGMLLDGLKAGSDGASCYVRARVRQVLHDGPDLLAYTNPVRIRVRSGVALPSVSTPVIAAVVAGAVLLLAVVLLWMRRAGSRRPQAATASRRAAPASAATQVPAAPAQNYHYSSNISRTTIEIPPTGGALTLGTDGRTPLQIDPGALRTCHLLLNARPISSLARGHTEVDANTLLARMMQEQKVRLGPEATRRIDLRIDFEHETASPHELNFYLRTGSNRTTRRGFGDSAQDALECFMLLAQSMLNEAPRPNADAAPSSTQAAQSAPVATDDPAVGGASIAGELTQLAQMKEQGLLSDEEFRQAKARLLQR